MHIIHNGITLGDAKLVMSRREAEQVAEILKGLLAKNVDTLHILEVRDTTGIAKTISAPEGSETHAPRVYSFEAASGSLGDPNL